MSRRINNLMSSGYKNAVRLICTEMNFVNNQATYGGYPLLRIYRRLRQSNVENVPKSRRRSVSYVWKVR